MKKLTDDQRQWWNRLRELLAENQGKEHAAIRKLALEVVAAQAEQDKIVVAGQVLIQFGRGKKFQFKTKQEYIRHHSSNGVWGDDPLLFSVLNALGYQPVMRLANTSLPAYIPFEQRANTGLAIEIVNHGAVLGGYHWERKGQHNEGGGNCMYHTVYQQVKVDLPEVSKQLPPVIAKPVVNNGSVTIESTQIIHARLEEAMPVVSLQVAHTAITNHQVQQAAVATQQEVAANPITKEVMETFKLHDVTSEKRKQEAAAKLQSFKTADLIAAYHIGIQLSGNDTYLKNRLEKYAPMEHGLEKDYFKKILSTGSYTSDNEFVLREELIQALAREAWRNPSAYQKLMNYSSAEKHAASQGEQGNASSSNPISAGRSIRVR